VLERYADPRALLAAGQARLTRLIATTSRGQLGQAKAQALRTAAAEAVALWDRDPAVAIEDLAAEVASEVRLVRAAQTERARHEHARDAALGAVDPAGLAASLPGLGWVGTTNWWPPWAGPDGSLTRRVQGLHRADPASQRDRPDRPQASAHDQGRPPGAAQPAGPGGQHRPQAGPPARLGLLPK
jgi:hypothetical protein